MTVLMGHPPDLHDRRKTPPLPTQPRLRDRPPLGYQRENRCHQPLARKGSALLFVTLYEIISYLINIIVIVVIAQFVLSLLISFNVVNMHNDFVAAIWRAVNAILDPILNPIRRIMPNTGMLDLSPMVLIIGLSVLQIILKNMAYATL
jgi:YggT family protein